MDRHHHRGLIVPTTQGPLVVPPMQELIVPADPEATIDVLEDDTVTDVERV